MFGASDAIVNTGSTARDWCMLERNILSHIKLDLLLSLLSLLRARLSGSDDDDDDSKPASMVASKWASFTPCMMHG